MLQSAMLVPNLTIGLDLGDKRSGTCEVDAGGEVVRRAALPTTAAGVKRYFGGRPPCRVILEVGTHSPWVSRQLVSLGHQAVVANPSAVYGKRRRKKRNDAMDAEFLARQGRADVSLLYPIRHRGPEVQQHLALLRSRDQLVGARSKLIVHTRGTVKALGGRIGACSAEAFPHRAASQIPEELRPALHPILEVIGELNRQGCGCRPKAGEGPPRWPLTKQAFS